MSISIGVGSLETSLDLEVGGAMTDRLKARAGIALGLVFMILVVLLPAFPAGAAPAAWPPSWAPYLSPTGGIISDTADLNPGYADLSDGGGATILPSVYVANDGTNAFFRFRIAEDPVGGGGLASTAYVVDLAVNGTLVGAVGINAKSPSSDYVYVADPSGAELIVYSNPQGFRVLPDGTGEFFIDFQVPISAVTSVIPQVTATTSVQLFYGTSQAANLTVINKDFMTGSAVSFAAAAPVTLQEAVLDLSKTYSHVSGPNPPSVGQTSTYDLIITASNAGTNPLQGAAVTDTIPANVSIVSTSTASGTISRAGQVVTWNAASIAPGGNATATIRVSATPQGPDAGTNMTLNPGAAGSGQDANTGRTTSDTSNAITVGPVGAPTGSPPIATDDAAATQEEQAVAIDVRTNDSDLNGDPLTLTQIVSAPSNGVATIGSGGNINYAPAANFSGQDSFIYEVCDNQSPSLCDSATVTVTVSPVNDPPVASPDSDTVPEDGSTDISVRSNDSDPEGDSLSVTSVTQGAHGSVTINGNGTISYVPDPDFVGSDTFTYTVCDDGTPVECDSATVSITVSDVNDPPTANDDLASTFRAEAISIPVLDNDSDLESTNPNLTIVSAGGASHGSVSIQGAQILYTPNPGYVGSDSFTYTIEDEGGATSNASVAVTVADKIEAPTADDDALSVLEDASVTADLLVNDSDPNPGDILTVTNVTDGSHGRVVINTNGTVTYTPDPDYFGGDTFSYTVCDDETPMECDSASVVVGVTPVNDGPVAADDLGSTNRNEVVTIDVLGNDSDPEGDAISIVSATQGTGGSVVIANGELVYTPTLGFVGPDSFTYVMTDGNGGTSEGTVNVTVSQTAQAPVAADDQSSIGEDGSIDIGVTGNDLDPNGDPLIVTLVGGGGHGTTSINNDGTIHYEPDPDYFGLDSFTYQVCDNDDPQGCDTAEVTVDVLPVNDPPVANADLVSLTEDGTVNIPVMANDTDPENDGLYIASVSTPAHGTVTFTPGGPVVYSPFSDFNGDDSFIYRVCDSGIPEQCSEAITTIVVSAENDPPTARDDIAAVQQSSSVVVPVLLNDSDTEGGAMSVVQVTQPSGPNQGSVSLGVDGSVTYTAGTATGNITFDYMITDPDGGTDIATVTVSVSTAAGPGAVSDTATVEEDGSVIVYVLDNDTGQGLILTSVTDAAHGTASLNVDGYTITYEPEPGFNGVDTVTYSVCDQNENCSTATVTVTVTPSNDGPVAGSDTLTVDEDVPGEVVVLANDSDLDGDVLVVTSVSDPQHGTVSVNPDGSIRYVPDPDYSGLDSFDYAISDGNGGVAVGSVSILVNPVNDAASAVDDVAVSEGRSVVVNVVVNDLAGEPGSSLAVVSVTDGTHGTVTINPDGSVTYKPNAGFSGSDVFSYTVCQTPEPLACDSANVTVEVKAVPKVDPPATTTTRATEIAGTKGAQPDDTLPHRDPISVPSRAQLPFTGIAIASLLLTGFGLIASGLVFTRRDRTPSSEN